MLHPALRPLRVHCGEQALQLEEGIEHPRRSEIQRSDGGRSETSVAKQPPRIPNLLSKRRPQNRRDCGDRLELDGWLSGADGIWIFLVALSSVPGSIPKQR